MGTEDKPDIEVVAEPAGPPVVEHYPALYEFRVIARHIPDIRNHVRKIVQAVVGHIPDDAVTERPSRGDKYLAIHVSCMLASEEQRRDVYARLHSDKAVVFLL